jgi:predicted DNA-binding transcriptional regulator AlpA
MESHGFNFATVNRLVLVDTPVCGVNSKPIRILAASIVARRLGVSRPTIAKYLRRGLIVADFPRRAKFRKDMTFQKEEARVAVGAMPYGLGRTHTAGTSIAIFSLVDRL